MAVLAKNEVPAVTLSSSVIGEVEALSVAVQAPIASGDAIRTTHRYGYTANAAPLYAESARMRDCLLGLWGQREPRRLARMLETVGVWVHIEVAAPTAVGLIEHHSATMELVKRYDEDLEGFVCRALARANAGMLAALREVGSGYLLGKADEDLPLPEELEVFYAVLGPR